MRIKPPCLTLKMMRAYSEIRAGITSRAGQVTVVIRHDYKPVDSTQPMRHSEASYIVRESGFFRELDDLVDAEDLSRTYPEDLSRDLIGLSLEGLD